MFTSFRMSIRQIYIVLKLSSGLHIQICLYTNRLGYSVLSLNNHIMK